MSHFQVFASGFKTLQATLRLAGTEVGSSLDEKFVLALFVGGIPLSLLLDFCQLFNGVVDLLYEFRLSFDCSFQMVDNSMMVMRPSLIMVVLAFSKKMVFLREIILSMLSGLIERRYNFSMGT